MPDVFPKYTDGYAGSDTTKRLIATSPKSYPFAHLGDVTTYTYTRTYLIGPGTTGYVPLARGTADPEGGSAVLIDEVWTGIVTDDFAEYTRYFALLPTTQTDDSKSQMVNRPNIPANLSYDLYKDGALVRASGGLLYSNTHLADYSSQTAYDVFGTVLAVTHTSVGAPTSGTWTFTYKATTITLNYNDSNATVAAAINAMASIIGDGITVTVLNGPFATSGLIQVRPTVGSWLAMPTANGAGLGPALAQTLDVYASGNDRVVSTRTKLVTPTVHGISDTSKPLALRSTVLNIVSSGNWSVYDTTTILVNAGAGSGTVNLLGKFLRVYTPGSSPIKADEVTRFSLSAITPDTYQGEGDTFFQAVFSGSTSINYRVGDAFRWPKAVSPIRALTTVKISAANL